MTVQKNSSLSIDWLERMANVLRVLAHPQRLKIVELLDEGRELPVHELTDAMAVPQATVSQHLNRMRAAGLLAGRRRGKEVWYRIADPDSLTVLNCIRKKHLKEV
jgi:DNA-binding transcriptional ArsR family regulator